MTTLEFEKKKIEKEQKNHFYAMLPKEVENVENIVEVVNYEPVELTTNITRIDITKIRGIGPSVAEKLRSGGFTTVEQIANTTPEQLADIRGVGQANAQKIIEGAQQLLPSKNLNDFPSAITPSITEKDSESSDDAEIESEEIEDFEIEEVSYEVNEEVQEETELLHHPMNEPSEPEIVPKVVPISPDHKISNVVVKESSERITREDKEKIIHTIISNARELGYEHLKMIPALRKIYSLIDVLLFKILPFNEVLDFIMIIPIKVSDLKGKLQISNDMIKYVSHNPDVNKASVYKTLLDTCLKQLRECEVLIHKDLREEGHFVDYFKRFHGIEISLRKTLLNRNLSFNSGNQQLKIFIEPMLLSKGTIGFLEKMIPFAYLKDINLHLIPISHLIPLIKFLERKYTLLESHSSQDISLVSYEEAQNQLFRRLEFTSVPFLGLAAVLLLLYAFHAFEVLVYFLNCCYAFFGIYIIMLLYFNMRFFKHKTELQQEFSTPYHKRELEFDETSLVLINEELTPGTMAQFVYECLGKATESRVITKVEELQVQERVEKERVKTRVNEGTFFEQRQEEKKEPVNEFVAKYSTFLED
jgi:predicted flap endonuclease-1-like 5' DNA nuclease